MKSFLAVIMVLCMASFVMAQPPQRGHGKFGAGKGKFGDPAKMAEARQKMMERRQSEDKPEVAKRPGPPPWAGKGMMQRGHRGPQRPFLGKGRSAEGKEKPDVRRGSGKAEVSGHHRGHRGQRGQHRGNKSETRRGGAEKQNHRGHTKSSGCKACACKDCPNNK